VAVTLRISKGHSHNWHVAVNLRLSQVYSHRPTSLRLYPPSENPHCCEAEGSSRKESETETDVNLPKSVDIYPYSTKKDPFLSDRHVRLIKCWNVEILLLGFGFLNLETIHKVGTFKF